MGLAGSWTQQPLSCAAGFLILTAMAKVIALRQPEVRRWQKELCEDAESIYTAMIEAGEGNE